MVGLLVGGHGGYIVEEHITWQHNFRVCANLFIYITPGQIGFTTIRFLPYWALLLVSQLLPVLLDNITDLILGGATIALCLAINTKARDVDAVALNTALVFDTIFDNGPPRYTTK